MREAIHIKIPRGPKDLKNADLHVYIPHQLLKMSHFVLFLKGNKHFHKIKQHQRKKPTNNFLIYKKRKFSKEKIINKHL